MKNLFLLIVLFITCEGLFAQPLWDTIYAVVNRNQVTIHQDDARQNCGFQPLLENITMENDSVLSWYQVDTTGIYYGCMCFFDYSITIDSLNPGNYTVLVYSAYNLGASPSSDTTYQGSAIFTIEEQANCDNILQLSSIVGICHEYDGLKEKIPLKEEYIISTNIDRITITILGTRRINKAVISNLSGQKIFQECYSSESEIQIPTTSIEKGIYIISLFDSDNRLVNKKVAII
jgi:hypothetical protein